MPTIQEALHYLGIDYADDMVTANVTRALETAKKVLQGSVGEDVETYLPNDSRVKELVLMYLNDLYSERGASAKTNSVIRRIVTDMEWQLRLELRKAKGEA